MLIPVVLLACGDPRQIAGDPGAECDTGVEIGDSGGDSDSYDSASHDSASHDSASHDSASHDSAAVDWPEPECEVSRWHLGDVVLEVEDDWALFCETGFNAIKPEMRRARGSPRSWVWRPCPRAARARSYRSERTRRGSSRAPRPSGSTRLWPR